MNVLITGSGGFIGHHLTKYLKNMGYWVRGVDLKKPEFEASPADEFMLLDLRSVHAAREAVYGMDIIYHLAATMGGIGFISSNHALCATDNTRIDLNMLEASVDAKVWRFFFSSSACVYNVANQSASASYGFAGGCFLSEDDAWPANPEPGYGLAKLYTEELCKYYAHDYSLDVRVARFHNIFGELTCYDGGREKAPAALCRKIAKAKDGDEIVVWGDGSQARSFLYISECLDGIYRIMHSQYQAPINLGSTEMVTIKQLAETIVGISGKELSLIFDPSKPRGVHTRNSDNRRIKEVIGWEPSLALREGLAKTYQWINSKVGA